MPLELNPYEAPKELESEFSANGKTRSIDWSSAFDELSEGVVAGSAVGFTVYATTRSEVMALIGGFLAFRASSRT